MKVETRFPIEVRLWRWWCTNGVKNRSDGTMGGSFFMRRLRDLYSILPGDRAFRGLIRIHDAGNVYVDVLDLHMYQMVLPQLQSGDPELLLAKTITPPGDGFLSMSAPTSGSCRCSRFRAQRRLRIRSSRIPR